MYLCPLDKAFPNYKDPNEESEEHKFNYVEANTAPFTMNMENKDLKYNELNTNVTNGCQNCPYCDKVINMNAFKKTINNNTLDILAISALTILIYSIISGKS